MPQITSLPMIFPSAGSLAFLSWPFWVVWLLKASSDQKNSLFFIRIGTIMGLLGLCIFPQNIDIITILFIIIENSLPLILFEVIHYHHKEARLLTYGWGETLPLLVIGCVLMGFLLYSSLGIIIIVSIGSVLLAWWEGRQPRRAFFAWDMVRSRLCGLIIASLGAGLLHVDIFHQNDSIITTSFFKKIGIIFFVCGLVMIANLGKRLIFSPILGLLDTGLRFVALILLSRLYLYPFAHHVMFLASCVGFCLFLFQKNKELSSLSLLTCLACFGASFGDETALFLAFIGSLLFDLLRMSFSFQNEYSQERYHMIILKSFLPILFVISIMIMRHTGLIYSLCMIFGLYAKLRHIDFKNDFHYPLSFWLSNNFWSQIFILCLFLFSFMGILFLAWHPLLSWTP